MNLKTCPDCLSDIPSEAVVCRHCGERVEGRPCPDCGARCWAEAHVCRECGHRFTSQDRRSGLEFDSFSVSANLVASVLIRGRLLTQTISLTQDKIVVTTPGVFNLSTQEEEIPWQKVAGFDYRSGIFWDQVTIETRGQSSTVLGCLDKSEGVKIRAVLQQLER